jgi:DNA-binding LacI/PurR family transcriptional regulator
VATIYDVAKIAGVSTKTVSRVLNEEPLVAEETKMMILEVIKQLDYHPNAMAARLKRQRSNIVGFVVPYGSEFVFQDLNMMEQLRGTHDIVTQNGNDLIISAPVDRNDSLQEILRLVKHKNVDGVILYPVSGVDAIIAELEQKNFKYVTLGIYKADQKTNFVNINFYFGGYQATKYLLAQGHRAIGIIKQPISFHHYYTEDMLLAAYQTALAEQKVAVTPTLIAEGDFTIEGGYQGFRQLWTASTVKPTAVICASDPMVYGAIRAIGDLGYVAGKDIEVITGDGLPLTRKMYPTMAAIVNPSYEQGRQAGKMLLTIIKEKKDQPGLTLDTDFSVAQTESK